VDYITQELIEKYKSEMQKMISNSPSAKNEEALKTVLNSDNNTQNENSQNSEQSTADENIGKFPYLSSQEPSPPRVKEFPEFETDSEGLTRRIEEILRQNSDVITSDDYPKPRNEDDSLYGEDNQNEAQNDEELNEVERPEMNMQPQNEDDETPAETVSRVCIRGGAKAQYSPPANTGLARNAPTEQTNALSDSGSLRVQAFAANRAFPIPNAVIRIRNKESNELVAVLTTDEDGNTEYIALSTPSRTLSQNAQSQFPYENYLVDIAAEGYVAQNDLNVQMFGGIEAVLPVNLFPQNNV